jgi:hypothetical protein
VSAAVFVIAVIAVIGASSAEESIAALQGK